MLTCPQSAIIHGQNLLNNIKQIDIETYMSSITTTIDNGCQNLAFIIPQVITVLLNLNTMIDNNISAGMALLCKVAILALVTKCACLHGGGVVLADARHLQDLALFPIMRLSKGTREEAMRFWVRRDGRSERISMSSRMS